MAKGTNAAADASTARPHEGPVRGLTVEHRTDPLGVDADRPRFGWYTRSATRGWRQGSYRILVASSAALLTADRITIQDRGPSANIEGDVRVDVYYFFLRPRLGEVT